MKNKKQRYVLNEEGKKVPLVEEQEYRKRIIAEARFKGCEIEMRMLFDKYDMLLRTCKNMQEAKDIGLLGVMEISKLLDSKDVGQGGQLHVDGKIILTGK